MLLDCTLRDGGFVNDWEFGYSSVRSIVSRLDKSGVEIIEVGFIDANREYDKNRSIFPDIQSIDRTLNGLSISQAMLVGMIDFGTCPAENVTPRDQSMLAGIRVIFKKKDINDALEFCSDLKNKGYKIFINPVSLTSYRDREILELLDKINYIEPFCMSIVDTYGLMLRDEILHYVDLVDNNLNPNIMLGYHSHNNQQMACANCCTILDRRNRHNIVIDTTLFGMGKSAGNANTELVASYINRTGNGKYKTEQLLDCIYTDIMRIYKKTPWGYNLHYYLSAVNDCHPNYIEFLLEKNTLSVQAIGEVIAMIPQEYKLTYSLSLIERLYIDYQKVSINDSEAYQQLSPLLSEKVILLVFPGNSINTNESSIIEFIEYNNPVVISVNFIPPKFAVDYVFTGNRKRYDKLSDSFFATSERPHIIATSNILESNISITYRLNYEKLIEPVHEITDYSAVLCLNFLKKLGIKQVSLAGMDGFSENSDKNFADHFMNMYSISNNFQQSNLEMKKYLVSLQEKMTLKFITPSIFAEGESLQSSALVSK